MMEIEEDRLVIGNIKALGISYRDIRNLYLNKFRFLSFVVVVFGYIISNIFTQFMTGRIERIFGRIDIGILGYIISIVIALIMHLIITTFVKAILKKIKKLSVIDIMVKNKGFSKSSDKKNKKTIQYAYRYSNAYLQFKKWILDYNTTRTFQFIGYDFSNKYEQDILW